MPELIETVEYDYMLERKLINATLNAELVIAVDIGWFVGPDYHIQYTNGIYAVVECF